MWVIKEQNLQTFVFACSEMNIGETDLFHCLARDRKSPERGNVANVFRQGS